MELNLGRRVCWASQDCSGEKTDRATKMLGCWVDARSPGGRVENTPSKQNLVHPLPPALFQRAGFQTHLDALRTRSALDGLWSACQKSFHQVIITDFPHLSAKETTTWTSCDYFSLTSFCVSIPELSGRLSIPQL